MADRIPVEILSEHPLQHPAVAAWNVLTGAGACPQRITQLNKGHSTVYRLAGIAPGGGSVIAKLCFLHDAEILHTIHAQVLPLLRKPALIFYDWLPEPGERAWVFLEDAGSLTYAGEDGEHRSAGSAWLAALHASLAGHHDRLTMPDAGLGIYLAKLRAGRAKILASFLRLTLTRAESTTLRSVLAWYDSVESRWDKCERLVEDGPRTLVHGDFAPKNVLMREIAGRLEAFPVDWETAGWGPPAVDLGESPDLSAYAAEARQRGVSWSMEMIRRWAAVGKILRHIAAFEWASESLAGGWPPRGIRRMQARLADAAIAALEI